MSNDDDATTISDSIKKRMDELLGQANRRAFLKASEREGSAPRSAHVDEVTARQYEATIDEMCWKIHQHCTIMRPAGVQQTCFDHTKHRAEAAALAGPPPEPVI